MSPVGDVLKSCSFSPGEKGRLSFKALKPGETKIVVASFHVGGTKVELKGVIEEGYVAVVNLFLKVFGSRGDGYSGCPRRSARAA